MIIQGDALTTLKTLPDNSAQMCVTSPPYFRLRDYGVDGQIGMENTPEEYILRLVDVFREVKRVLKSDGTLWVNIGDSYNGSGKNSGKPDIKREYMSDAEVIPAPTRLKSLKPKDLIGIPWMLAFALRDDGWWLRQDIIWAKPNPMPESVFDRCTRAHEYVFMLSVSSKYYYNNKSIAEPTTTPSKAWESGALKYGGKKYTETPGQFNNTKSGNVCRYAPTRNKRDVWAVATIPIGEAHFAAYPPELIRPCIKAGTRPGDVVLDPFFGAGTTGIVAIEEGREYIGVELNPEYIEIAKKRLSSCAYQERLFGEPEAEMGVGTENDDENIDVLKAG